MHKAKPTLKQYLNNYQSKSKSNSKSPAESLRGSGNSHHPNLIKIQDKIQCLKTILKLKLDQRTYDAVCYQLEEIKTLERATFTDKLQIPQTGEPNLSRTINRSVMNLRHPKQARIQKENLQPPPYLNPQPYKLTRLQQSEVDIKDEDNLEESGNIENVKKKIKKVGFVVEGSRPSIQYEIC